MAKDDRRKTFAANNAKERKHDRAVHDEQRGRRRTCGAPVIERTTHDTQQQLLRDEKLLNEPKLKPLELKNHHETIQDQLQTYKKKLASDLQDDLSRADLELHNGMADLANTFDEKCSIIHDAGEVFRGHITDEILEVNKEQIMLNEYMERFKGLYQQKETKLRGLWEDYVNVQKQIMELALVILDDDDVAIAVSNPGEESDPAEQTPSKDPELDEMELWRDETNSGKNIKML